MTHSIRRQLALIFIGLMAGTIFLCWLMNNLFLGQYYIRSRTEVIYEAYHKIQQAERCLRHIQHHGLCDGRQFPAEVCLNQRRRRA